MTFCCGSVPWQDGSENFVKCLPCLQLHGGSWFTKRCMWLPRCSAEAALVPFFFYHLHLLSYMHLPQTSLSSVQFSHSAVSDSLRPHESQHARPHCPSPTPGIHSNSCPLSQWYHPAISSSVVPFSSCPQSLPASESFPMSQLFAWGGQGTEVSALASFLPKNTQGWSPLEWTGWISLQSKRLSRVFSKHKYIQSFKKVFWISYWSFWLIE